MQPPTGLYVAAISGNLVTLRWTPPAGGPTPTAYVLEGGVNPGQVLASIPTGSAYPSYTFVAPSGAFYIRLHTLAASARSSASTEVRLFVNVPQPPSAPAALLGMVNGSAIALSWNNTFAGGAPSGLVLDVTGSLTTTIPLGLSDSFSFAAVPNGTYALALRATNAAGSSPPSNSVTLTFPGPCSGVPQTPTDFLATKSGSVITVRWNAPTGGPAASLYVLNVSGAFAGAFTTPGRALSGNVGPGSYTLTLYAANACGNGAATPPVTITVP